MLITNTSENKMFYATPYSAGFDICSAEDGVLAPGEYRLFKTGLWLGDPVNQTPPKEYAYTVKFTAYIPGDKVLLTALEELQIRPRSGLAFNNGVTVLNSPGTVDSDFPNEIGVLLINHGKLPFEVKNGDRIAQGVVALVLKAKGVEVKPDARTGGFGSTGK